MGLKRNYIPIETDRQRQRKRQTYEEKVDERCISRRESKEIIPIKEERDETIEGRKMK